MIDVVILRHHSGKCFAAGCQAAADRYVRGCPRLLWCAKHVPVPTAHREAA
jgi:hypothetical protein